MDSDRAQLPARESQAHLLPFDRVPAGSLARQQHYQSHARSGRGTTYQGQEPGLDRSARAGTRPRAGQWRVGTFGGVLSGFDGYDAVARDWLRTALRIRNVQAVDQGWLAGGAAGPLAAAHRSLANHAGSGHRRSEAELLLRDDRRKLAPRGREAVATVRHPARSSDSRIRRPNHQFTSTLGRRRAGLLRLSGIQPGRFRGRARGEAGRRDSDESAVSRRFDQPGTSTAIHPGVLSGRMLAGGYHPALPAQQRRLELAARQGRRPAQRYASGDCGGGADADAARRRQAGMGSSLGPDAQNAGLHQPYAVARSAREVAGGVVRDGDTAPPRDHF